MLCGVNSVDSSPGNHWLAFDTVNCMIPLHDLASSDYSLMLQGHTRPVNAFRYSREGERLVSGFDDTTVRLRDAGGGTELNRLEGR